MAFETAGRTSGGMMPPRAGENLRLAPANLLSFRGYASRRDFWLVVAATLAIGGLTDTALQLLVPLDELGRPSLLAMAVSSIVWLAAAWAQSAVVVRRLRDRGQNATMILAWCLGPPLIAVVGLLLAPMLPAAAMLMFWQIFECGVLPGCRTRPVDLPS